MFRKGNSDNVHFQKGNPFTLATTDLPYNDIGLSKCKIVFDAERYIECVKPMPIPDFDQTNCTQFQNINFRFQTTHVTRKRDGTSYSYPP